MITLTPEQVDVFVREAIMKSGIVTAIENAIDKNLTGYNSPVDEAVKKVIKDVIISVLQEPEWNDRIREAVVAALTARVSKEALEKIANAAVDKIEAATRF